MLSKSSDQGYPCLVSVEGKLFRLVLSGIDVSSRFFVVVCGVFFVFLNFIELKKFPFIAIFLSVFIMNGYRILLNTFSVWLVRVLIFLLQSVNVVYTD
jgi:hypothetical protein